MAARIAVVIPCYDDGATLPEALESIRERESVDVLIVDDGSTDAATAAAIERARDGGAQVLRQANAGVAAAINSGAEASQAPFVFVLAADDLLDEGALGELVDALEADPGAAFAYGHVHLFGGVDFVRRSPPWSPWILTHANYWYGSTLFRRSALLAAGGFRANVAHEDWDLYMTLAERGERGILVERTMLHYRIHGDGRRFATGRRRYAETYRELREHHAELFSSRASLRRAFPPTLRQRVGFPLQTAAFLYLPPALVPRLHAIKLWLQQWRRRRPSAPGVRPPRGAGR